VQIGSTTYERRQQIEGVGSHIWNGSEKNNSRQLRKDLLHHKFNDKPKLLKKFKPDPESVDFKHVYLIKNVAHQPPLGQDKKGY
jgi:hypothetical protein